MGLRMLIICMYFPAEPRETTVNQKSKKLFKMQSVKHKSRQKKKTFTGGVQRERIYMGLRDAL